MAVDIGIWRDIFVDMASDQLSTPHDVFIQHAPALQLVGSSFRSPFARRKQPHSA